MKKVFLLFLMLPVFLRAQKNDKIIHKLDSLKELISSDIGDTTLYNTLVELGNTFQTIKPDSAIYYHEKARALAAEKILPADEAEAVRLLGWDHFFKNEPDKTKEYQDRAKVLAEKVLADRPNKQNTFKAKRTIAACISGSGVLYKNEGNIEKALLLFNEALDINRQIGNTKGMINNYGNLAIAYSTQGENKKAIKNYDLGIELALKINSLLNLSTLYGNKGLTYNRTGNYHLALENYQKAMKIDETLENWNGVTRHLGNMGLICKNQGEFVKALEYNFRALKIAEQMGEKRNQASLLGSIGIVYSQLSEFKNAESYYRKALQMNEEIGDKQGVSMQYGHIGILYMLEGDSALEKNNTEAARAFYKRSLEYYDKAIKIDEELNNKPGVANTLGNVGLVYEQLKEYEKSAEYQMKALKVYIEINDVLHESITRGNIGTLYTRMKKYPLAEKYIKESIKLAGSVGDKNELKFGHQYLYTLYKAWNRPELALNNYELFIAYRDSIFNEENTRATLRQELKFGYDKKAAADSVKASEEKKVINAQLKQEQTQRYALYGGLSLVALFSVFMVNRFRVTNRQKKVIEEQKYVVEEQKKAVEEKQKEILDSIHYAKRIQTALMPSDKYVKRNLARARGNT